MPIPFRRSPPRRHKKNDMDPRVLSSDEKRELILAHAASRDAKPKPEWSLGYYIGILASCLVVVTGWWMTLPINLQTQRSTHSDAAWESMMQKTRVLLDQLKTNQTQLEGAAQTVRSLQTKVSEQEQKAVLQERAMEETARRLKAMAATSTQP